MSFYHVLTSNVAPKTFPNNSASKFSTPIYNPYDLNGKWEVAVTQMTHNNCVYTFNGEQYGIEDSVWNENDLERLDDHFKFDLHFSKKTLPRAQFYKEFMTNVKDHTLLNLILQLSESGWRLEYKVLHPEFFVCLPQSVQRACKFMSPVLTSYDRISRTGYKPPDTVTIEDTCVIVGKISVNAVLYELKEKNTEMTMTELMKIYNEKLPSSITSLSRNHSTVDSITFTKKATDGTIMILSEGLTDLIKPYIAGFWTEDIFSFNTNNLSKDYSLPWTVSFIERKHAIPFKSSAVVHNLAKRQFTTRSEAYTYLNSFDKRVTFSCNDRNVTTMKIHGKYVTVTFDDDLRDILAFDENEYKGPNTFTATGTFSLSRRIHYLYIYCNINQHIRIGDTQAPLIAILPYNGSICVPHIERTFKNPMYVSLIRNNIAQIDIEIRDDTGQLIPFTEDALTSIRLHFRQVYANV